MRTMRFLLAAAAAVVLLAGPALAGGDWDYDDGRYYRDYSYYEGPYEYYAGFWPPRWAAPRYVAPVPYPPYAGDGYYAGDYAYDNGGDCVVKRKWRRGRYVEKIDCDD